MPRAAPAGCPTRSPRASAAAPTRSGSSARSSTTDVAIYGFEAGGDGVETGRHAATIAAGDSGVLHGARTFVLQDEDGQTIESHSISAGLDYPGVGPQHAHLAQDPAGPTTCPSPTRRPWTPSRCWPAPRASSPPSSRRTRWPGRYDVARRLGPEGLRPGQPQRPRRQGHGDRDRVVRPGRRPMTAEHAWRTAFETARAEGRAALVGYLPAGFPDVDGGIEALRTMVDVGLRRHRGRPALQRPGHGRPDDPGRRAAGARRGRAHQGRAAHGRGGRRDRRPGSGDDLLEPRRALRPRAVRRRSRRRRGSRADHPRPHPRQRRRVDRRRRRRTASTRSSSSHRRPPTRGWR